MCASSRSSESHGCCDTLLLGRKKGGNSTAELICRISLPAPIISRGAARPRDGIAFRGWPRPIREHGNNENNCARNAASTRIERPRKNDLCFLNATSRPIEPLARSLVHPCLAPRRSRETRLRLYGCVFSDCFSPQSRGESHCSAGPRRAPPLRIVRIRTRGK